MPRFLTAQRTNKSSIDALADSQGKAALIDFLIIKRTLAIKGQLSRIHRHEKGAVRNRSWGHRTGC
ncbi:hypothetical protein [Orrella marina]|uniref:Uncharacterized protein n=1 Tax=Orrella marina TaxID=2163011 RepID=A0A2R4XFE5_9BURK|nr:hypothetical protein [Orrella marina]AWB32501.1 hypothetical protein DBV39_00840 [Orrella marina]